MLRRPSLSALRTFEAVARLGGFTRAAAELGVTQAAVSRHMARLERELGMDLLVRGARGTEPTEAGATLFAALRRAFGDIEQALEEIGARGARETLTVSVAPYFSARWLTPRLPRFMGGNPRIDLRLHHSYVPPDFRRDRIDLGINWGPGDWPGTKSEPVLSGELTAVVNRSVFEDLAPKKPQDLARLTLLHEFDIAHWEAWFKTAGAKLPAEAKSLRIDDSHALRRATLDGQGAALFFVGLMQEDLASGHLVQPFPVTVDVGQGYWLNYPSERELPNKAKVFRTWLKQEIEREPYC